MASRRKKNNNAKAHHRMLLRKETETLNKKLARLARKERKTQIKSEDADLASALTSVSVNAKNGTGVPFIGAPISKEEENKVHRHRPSKSKTKSQRRRHAKLLVRQQKQRAMSGIVKPESTIQKTRRVKKERKTMML